MSLRPRAVTAIAALAVAGGAALGQAQPRNTTMTLGVAQSGVVQSIDTEDGAHVEAGQVLVELDCAPLREEIEVRTAALEAAEAVYDRVVHGPRPEEIAIGEAGVGVAEARAEEARAALDRANAMEVGVATSRAQLLVVERDSRVAEHPTCRRTQEACAPECRIARRGYCGG